MSNYKRFVHHVNYMVSILKWRRKFGKHGMMKMKNGDINMYAQNVGERMVENNVV